MDKFTVHALSLVDIVLADLLGRKGVGNELENIDPEIYQEIRLTNADKIKLYLKEQADDRQG